MVLLWHETLQETLSYMTQWHQPRVIIYVDIVSHVTINASWSNVHGPSQKIVRACKCVLGVVSFNNVLLEFGIVVCFFIFNVTLVLIIRYYCFSDWFNQVNIICDHVHIYCIIDARLQLAYETLQHITIGQRREEHGENCYLPLTKR